jgi:hypothetical protein
MFSHTIKITAGATNNSNNATVALIKNNPDNLMCFD